MKDKKVVNITAIEDGLAEGAFGLSGWVRFASAAANNSAAG